MSEHEHHEHGDEPCEHEILMHTAYATGTVFGSLVGAMDSAGEQPISVDRDDLEMATAMSYAFIDGFTQCFARAIEEREGTSWRVSGHLVPAIDELHAMVSMLGDSLVKIREVMEESQAEEGSGDRVVLGRSGDSAVTLGFTSEETLDEAILEQARTDGPSIRFVGLMDHFGVRVGDD